MLSPNLQQVDRTFVRLGKRKLIYFGGCDYFRLASHPSILEAVRDGLERYGLNVAASRRTTGNHRVYEQLEEKLAQFFGVESAVLVSSGYVTNLTVAQALAGEFSHVLIDEHSHACLKDAAAFFDCPILTFKHRDAEDTARVARRCGNYARPVLLTDGMFSHDGELAPLPAYLQILPADGAMMVDDAHGAGTLGESGQGTIECLGVSRKRVTQTVTLSKAFGVYGGAILGSRALKKKILAKSHAFVGNTPLPLPLACAVVRALEILRSDKTLRQRLNRNTRFAKASLRHAGLAVSDSSSPIVALVPRNAKAAARLKKELLVQRIYPCFIRYPGGPKDGYFRFAISSEHSLEQVTRLVNVLTAHVPA